MEMRSTDFSSTVCYPSAAFALGILVFLAAILSVQSAFPLLLLALPSYALASLIPTERWERWMMVPILGMVIIDTIVYSLAMYDCYSPHLAMIIIGGLNLIAAIHLFRQKPVAGDMRVISSFFKITLGDQIAIGFLLTAMAVPFFYGMVFSFVGFNNSPHPAFCQMGLDIMRTGSFHLMPWSEACYNTNAFFYTPAYPGMMAWISSFVPVERLDLAVGFLVPLLLTSFVGITLTVGYRMGWPLKATVLGLLLLFPSYSLFKISYELDSDTPGLPCAALFFYLLIRLSTEKSPHQNRLWLLVAILWFFSWWIRIYLGLFFTFTLAALFVCSGTVRASLKELTAPSKRPWVRPVRLGLLLLLFALGPFWETLLWFYTGSPLAPRSAAPVGIDIGKIRPEFLGFESTRPRASAPNFSVPSKKENTTLQALRHDFFPVRPEIHGKAGLVKNIRSLLHGNTFSGIFTLFLVGGIFLSAFRFYKEGVFSPYGVAILYVIGMLFFFISNAYYYKVLFAGVPIFIFFVVTGLTAFFSHGEMKKGTLINICNGVLTLVYLFSFLWAGVGTWPEERRWGLFKFPFSTKAEREWIKNGDSLEPAIDYLKAQDPKGKLLYFHSEPGHALSYALDRRPFWSDYHYNSQLLAGLHRLETPEKVVRALKALHISHIVLTFDLERFMKYKDPEILPRMLKNGDPRLKEVAASTGGTYRIFQVGG